MRATGIVRKVDCLDRIVIPKEICRSNGIGAKTPIEIFTDGDLIILKKYTPGCIFCESMDDVTEFKGKHVCSKCRKGE